MLIEKLEIEDVEKYNRRDFDKKWSGVLFGFEVFKLGKDSDELSIKPENASLLEKIYSRANYWCLFNPSDSTKFIEKIISSPQISHKKIKLEIEFMEEELIENQID